MAKKPRSKTNGATAGAAASVAAPHLSADGTGNLYEEVSIKPIRLELA